MRYLSGVDFIMHQDQMAQTRCREQGGFNGDRITECKLPTLYAAGTDWLKVVVEKSDLSQSNLANARIRETMIAHTALRRSRMTQTRLERVEFYFDDLNELDLTGASARRCKWHACELMNANFSGAQIAVSRF